MKLVFQIAGGIVLATLILWAAGTIFAAGAVSQLAAEIRTPKAAMPRANVEPPRAPTQAPYYVHTTPGAEADAPKLTCKDQWSVTTTSGETFSGCGAPPAAGIASLRTRGPAPPPRAAPR